MIHLIRRWLCPWFKETHPVRWASCFWYAVNFGVNSCKELKSVGNCIGKNHTHTYIYTVYYTYIFQISDNYAKNWYKVRVVQEYHRRHGRCWPRTSTSPTTRSHGGWQKIMGAVKWERCLVFFDALLTLVGDTLLLAMDSNDFRFHQFSSFFKNMFVAI